MTLQELALRVCERVHALSGLLKGTWLCLQRLMKASEMRNATASGVLTDHV